MKRIFSTLIVLGAFISVFASTKVNASNEDSINIEKLSVYILQGDSVLDIFKKCLDNTKKQQRKIDELKEQKTNIESTLKKVESIITSPIIGRMFVEYPLCVRYDSALIAHTLQIIKGYKIDKQKEHKEYYELMLPILRNYSIYNQELYDIIEKIKKHIEYSNPYSYDDFLSDLKKTSYSKNCLNRGLNIKYLDDIINSVRSLIQKGEYTKDDMASFLIDLKE